MIDKQRSLSTKLPHCVERILTAWRNVSADDLDKGLGWYSRAHEAALAIHPNTLIGAGVIAALSPRCEWATNLEWAERVCKRALSGSRIPPSVSTTINREKAWYIAQLPEVEATPEVIQGILKPYKRYGYKIERFFRNITGDTQAVTVDTWAARVAEGGVYDQDHINGARYEMLERAYQVVAKTLGKTPRDVQAAVWVNVRGSAD